MQKARYTGCTCCCESTDTEDACRKPRVQKLDGDPHLLAWLGPGRGRRRGTSSIPISGYLSEASRLLFAKASLKSPEIYQSTVAGGAESSLTLPAHAIGSGRQCINIKQSQQKLLPNLIKSSLENLANDPKFRQCFFSG